MEQMPDNSVDCIYTDIPYLYSQNKTQKLNGSVLNNKIVKAFNSITNAKMADGIDIKKFFKQIFRIMKGSNLFVWCSIMQIRDILNEIAKYTKATQNILVWCKNNPIPLSGCWLSDIEYCIVVRENTSRLNDGYELKSKWYVSCTNQKDKLEYEHPTIKPLELVKRHLLHATQPNDVVLDCFLGSGTTAVACKEIGRRYIGFEIDKNYYEIAKDRLNGVSQKDKKLKEKGIQNLFDFIDG